MNYILDTNIILAIKNKSFPFDDNNMDFWNFLLELAQQNYFKLPEKVIDELESGTDPLGMWIASNKADFKIATLSVLTNSSLTRVLTLYDSVRGTPLTEEEQDYLDRCANPYIIAHALTENSIVVTAEVMGGIDRNMNIKKIKIPLVCQRLGVPYISELRFMWELSQKYAELRQEQPIEI